MYTILERVIYGNTVLTWGFCIIGITTSIAIAKIIYLLIGQ